MSTARDRALSAGLSVALFAATLGLILLALWWRLDAFRSRLPGFDQVAESGFETRGYARLTADDVLQLGWAQRELARPPSSYAAFPEEKSVGKTRIGVFGCSFVFGAEVPRGADFPTYLQQALIDAGRDDVEVINFGVGGYGIHQSIMMFRRLGVRYDLDIAMFNFYGFHRGRDDTFLPVDGDYGPLHARYVPGPVGPTLSPVVGSDRRDAAEIYFSLIPRWQYLRYDARPPPMLRALLPAGRSLPFNPFFHAREEPDSGERLYASLLDELVDEVPRLVAICNESDACRFAPYLARSETILLDVVSPRAIRSLPSIYMAPAAHFGSLGNELVGEELAAFLLGKRRWSAPFIEWAGPAESGPALVRNGELATGHIEIGDVRVASLVEHKPGAPSWVHEPADFTGRGVAALLDLFDGFEFRFAQLSEQPADHASVEIVFALGSDEIRAEIGVVRGSAGRIVRITDWRLQDPGGRWRIAAPLISGIGQTTIAASESVSGLELRIGGVPVLRAPARISVDGNEQRFSFEPIVGPFVRVRAATDGPIRIASLAKAGTVDVVLETASGETVREPLQHYRIAKRRMRSLPQALAVPLLAE